MSIWPFHRAVPRYDHTASLATVNAMAQDHVPDKVSPPPVILNQFADISDNYALKWAISPPPKIPPQTSIPAIQPATTPEETHMASILVDIETGVEVAASDVLKFITGAEAKLSLAPNVLAAVATVLGSVTAAATATESAAASGGTNITLDNAALAALKSVWPAVQSAFKTVGVTV